jgi:hypothetical protein
MVTVSRDLPQPVNPIIPAISATPALFKTVFIDFPPHDFTEQGRG